MSSSAVKEALFRGPAGIARHKAGMHRCSARHRRGKRVRSTEDVILDDYRIRGPDAESPRAPPRLRRPCFAVQLGLPATRLGCTDVRRGTVEENEYAALPTPTPPLPPPPPLPPSPSRGGHATGAAAAAVAAAARVPPATPVGPDPTRAAGAAGPSGAANTDAAVAAAAAIAAITFPRWPCHRRRRGRRGAGSRDGPARAPAPPRRTRSRRPRHLRPPRR